MSLSVCVCVSLFFLLQVTCNYFQMMNSVSAPSPVQFQTLAESSRVYEPGAQFADFIRIQKAASPAAVHREYTFEPYHPGSSAGLVPPVSHASAK